MLQVGQPGLIANTLPNTQDKALEKRSLWAVRGHQGRILERPARPLRRMVGQVQDQSRICAPTLQNERGNRRAGSWVKEGGEQARRMGRYPEVRTDTAGPFCPEGDNLCT